MSMEGITPDDEALHMVIALGNFEDLRHTGSNTYALAQRVTASDWLKQYTARVQADVLDTAIGLLSKDGFFSPSIESLADELRAASTTGSEQP